MGFDPIGWFRPASDRYRGHTITRQNLKDSIERGIQRANLDTANQTLATALRRVADSNEYITIGAWGLKTDLATKPVCGCPLTEAGYVDVSEGNPKHLKELSGSPGLREFWRTFDDVAKRYVHDRSGSAWINHGGSVIARVI